MTLLVLTLTCYLNNNFRKSILYGSVAVLCTGWPFMGVLLLPLGIIMLYFEYQSKRIAGVVNLCLYGVFAAASILTITLAVERYYYGTW